MNCEQNSSSTRKVVTESLFENLQRSYGRHSWPPLVVSRIQSVEAEQIRNSDCFPARFVCRNNINILEITRCVDVQASRPSKVSKVRCESATAWNSVYEILIDNCESVEKGYLYCCTIKDYPEHPISNVHTDFVEEILKSFFYVVERLFFTSSRNVFPGEFASKIFISPPSTFSPSLPRNFPASSKDVNPFDD